MRSTERPYTCIWLPICVSSKFWSWHAPFRRYSPLKTQLYLLWPLKVKVKGNEVNWNTIYDLLYVFHINFGHDKHNSGDTAHSKLNYLDLTFKGHPRSKVMTSTERPYMTYYMCRNLCHNMHHSEDTAH